MSNSMMVVSTATRLTLFSLVTQDFCAAWIVWVSSYSTAFWQICPRQRASDDGSIGERCWKNDSSMKHWP
jgi:hypothetical protein